MKLRHLCLLTILLLTVAGSAQAGVPVDAAKDIDAGNRDWGVAMVRGDAKLAADAYAPDGVFCDAKGVCTTGHDAIEAMTAARIAKTGALKSAEAHTLRRIEDQGLVYEWGEATLVNAQGKSGGGGYFTIWRRQPDGHWKIFRNLVLP
ncbi:MAG TPA: nuclear transport factor 2 family protein [Gammaproteobacteria bacterium]